MSDPQRWTRQTCDRLAWHHWGEAYFVFHPASGQTHFLNELAAFAVRLLEQGPPQSTAEIYTATRLAYGLEDAPDLRQHRPLRPLAGLWPPAGGQARAGLVSPARQPPHLRRL